MIDQVRVGERRLLPARHGYPCRRTRHDPVERAQPAVATLAATDRAAAVVVGAAVPAVGEHRRPRDVDGDRGRRALGDAPRAWSRAPRSSPKARRPSAPGSAPATCCWRSTASRSSRRDDVVEHPARARSAATRSTYTVLAAADAARLLDASPSRRFPSGARGALLRARGGRHLHAARRRRGAAAPAGQSGDAALLLAVGRVLRRARVLVQRPARSLDWVFYWADVDGACCCCRRSSCTSRWCSPSGRDSWVRSDAGRTLLPLLYLPALLLGAARVAALIARGVDGEPCSRACSTLRRARRAALSRGQPGRRPGDHDPRAAARALGHRAPPAALDRLGHGARRGAVRRSATPCRSRSASTPLRGVECTARAARPRPARLCLGHRPLPADGRRGHHQARAGLRGGAGGDRGDLRRAARSWPARSSSAATDAATRSSRCSRRSSWCCWRGR